MHGGYPITGDPSKGPVPCDPIAHVVGYRHMANGAHGQCSTWAMGHMGNGAHGQWSTWIMGHMGSWAMGHMDKDAKNPSSLGRRNKWQPKLSSVPTTATATMLTDQCFFYGVNWNIWQAQICRNVINDKID